MWRSSLIVLFSVLTVLPFASHADGPSIAATHVWVHESPPGSGVTLGYMRLENLSDQTLTLVNITSPDFESVAIHNDELQDDKSKTSPVVNLSIPAHQYLNFAASGYYLVLTKPAKTMYEGDLVTLILAFSDHSSLSIMAPMRRDQPAH